MQKRTKLINCPKNRPFSILVSASWLALLGQIFHNVKLYNVNADNYIWYPWNLQEFDFDPYNLIGCNTSNWTTLPWQFKFFYLDGKVLSLHRLYRHAALRTWKLHFWSVYVLERSVFVLVFCISDKTSVLLFFNKNLLSSRFMKMSN